MRPERPGHITPELVERELSSRTRLVALASCHYLSGWRIDVDAIGESLHKRGVLFSVDAIQTLGAFPFSVRFVDFLSADAHKWMLGPMAIGIVYVARQHFELCRPTLLGSWNIHSPQFLAQETIKFHETAQRYEPGVLNVAGAYGMKASLEMIEATGLGTISAAILDVRDHLHRLLEHMGFEFLSPSRDEPLRSGIVTARHPRIAPNVLFSALEKEKITASLRMARECGEWLRFSPHFYNTGRRWSASRMFCKAPFGLKNRVQVENAPLGSLSRGFCRFRRQGGGPRRPIDKLTDALLTLQPRLGKEL